MAGRWGGASGFECLDGDVPFEHRDRRSRLAQLLAQAPVLRSQVVDAVLQYADGFGVGAVPGDPFLELVLQVLVAVGEDPPFDSCLVGKGT